MIVYLCAFEVVEMAQRNNSRIDRFAQMSKQEELIAKKRQEILEKQRTAELAKKVAAQMLAVKVTSGGDVLDESNIVTDNDEKSDEECRKNELDINTLGKLQANTSLASKTGKITFGAKRPTIAVPLTEQPPSKIQNSFCNDGSFLENFKKILEKQQQQQTIKITMIQATDPEVTKNVEEDLNDTEANTNETGENVTETVTLSTASMDNTVPLQQQQQEQQYLQQQHEQQRQPQQEEHQQQLEEQAAPLIPPPPAPPTNVSFQFNATLLAPRNQILIPQRVADPNVAAAAAFFGVGTAAAPPSPATPTTIAAMLMPMHAVSTAAPPPPPLSPQLPLALANLTPLYMIPAPEPLRLNTIPQPKQFDLNAIPKPQLNVEAIQMPISYNEQPSSTVTNVIIAQEQQQQQQQQQHRQLQIITTQASLQQEQHKPQQLHQAIHDQIQTNNLSTRINLQEQEQHQQHREQQELRLVLPQKVFSDDFNFNNNIDAVACEDNSTVGVQETEMPTTLENLIGIVADKGDSYEEILRGRKSQLPPAMWFICDKDSEPYHRYRQQVIDRRQENLKEQQKRAEAEREQRENEKQSIKKQPCSIVDEEDEEDKYDPESVISADNDSDDEYRRGMMDRNRDNIKRRIECRNELSEEERLEREDEEQQAQRRQERKKLRKSRWGGKVAEMATSLSSRASTSSVQSSFANQNKPLLTAVTRNDPALLQYAKLNYGSINLSEEDWKKCEEHYKVNLLYQDMMRKRQEIDRLARSGKFKYEYDSDEDVSGGTWEHKLRTAEMEATKAWASALTKQSEGKHHIGDFLPPEELKKFMEQYEAKKNNRQPDLSDYKEYKLKEDNKGFQMLQKLGWKEGQGLGQDGEGIVNPINKGPQREGNQGLGVQNAAIPDDCDNEYDAYRKRMMLAYRFRPNPLNNPRRAYY